VEAAEHDHIRVTQPCANNRDFLAIARPGIRDDVGRFGIHVCQLDGRSSSQGLCIEIAGIPSQPDIGKIAARQASSRLRRC